MTLYENIRARRTALKMTQQELAIKLGYKSTSTIAKIEAGKSDIPQSKIIAFANSLNITPDVLMGWKDNNVITPKSVDVIGSQESVMVLLERVKDLCRSRKISIPKLEEHLGFGAGTISKWKKSAPGTDKLLKVADFFQVSLDVLLDRNERINLLTEPEQVLLYAFRELNDDGRIAVTAFLKWIGSKNEYKNNHIRHKIER